MTNYIISIYAFFLLFLIAYFLPKYNSILFMVQLDKNTADTEPFSGILYRFRKQCFSYGAILSALSPFLEDKFPNIMPYFFISTGLSVYLFVIFALYLTSSREVIKERLAYHMADDEIKEKAEYKPVSDYYHYLLHGFIIVKLIHFTMTLPYEYINFSMLEYPIFSVITLIIALIADRKFRKQSLVIYFISLFLITSFSVIQQAFMI